MRAARERSPHRPTESSKACPANRARGAATQSTLPHGASTRRESDSSAWHPSSRAAFFARRRRRIAGSRAEVAAQDRRVGVDPSIAQEGPVTARLLDQRRIAARNQNLWFRSRLRENAAERVGD